jgi:transposase
MDKKAIEKEAYIAEYFTCNLSYRKIGSKYGIGFRIVYSWVVRYQCKSQKQNHN